jgi:hypothetical protein
MVPGIESTGSDLSRAGRWTLPEDVQEIGDEQDLEYDAAGAWRWPRLLRSSSRDAAVRGHLRSSPDLELRGLLVPPQHR